MGKIFNKGLDKDEDKKEGLLKRLKNIEDKNEKLLEVKNKTENIKEVTDFANQPLRFEAMELIEEIIVIQKDVDYRKLKIRGSNDVDCDFSDYKTFKELFRDLYYKKVIIDDVEANQYEFDTVMNSSKNYIPRNNKYTEAKNKLLNYVKKFYEGRKKIIEGFKNEIFPVYYDKEYEYQKKLKSEEESEENKIFKYIENESKGINYELFEKHFSFVVPSVLAKKLFETKDKKKNSELVKEIKNRWNNLKDEIKKMSKNEIEIGKPNKIFKIVKDILEFNKKIQNKLGGGLKMLTPNQMLSRLPITLAQLKAGNNSEKLKNEIRQLLYSLYRSKKLTKQLYKSLIDII